MLSRVLKAETNSTSIRRRRRSTFCDSTVPRHDFLVPNGIANGVARAISVSKNNTCACATDLATGCSTVFEAFSDTSRRQRFFGVGGSGRSPLECTTFEIRAVARAIAVFSFSRAARAHSGAVRSGTGRTRNRNGFRCRCQPAGF